MNILITGGRGFIGSNIIDQIKGHSLFEGNRDTIDLYSKSSIKDFIRRNKIDAVIHCAIEGGKRLKKDDADIVYKNLMMFENLMYFKDRYNSFINISSGSEFDRTHDIRDYSEIQLYNNTPKDYYGFSKNIISKLVLSFERGTNLRIFGCFGRNESPDRFIKASLINYINNTPIIVHEDKYMDFIHIDDVCRTISHVLYKSIHDDINLCYMDKYKLTDIVNIINNLTHNKVTVQILKDNVGLSYTGNGLKLSELKLELIGLQFGIKACHRELI